MFRMLICWNLPVEIANLVSLIQVTSKALPYVITSEDNIYHTNEKTNTISCHKINGDKLWEFQDVARIREPNGVAIDRDLNVPYKAKLFHQDYIQLSYILLYQSRLP
jgi:hypothetical protein